MLDTPTMLPWTNIAICLINSIRYAIIQVNHHCSGRLWCVAGTPVRPGSWGDWATIHSELSDETRRQNGEYTAPGVANADNLNGVECKYARNLSYQLIVCQNSYSLFAGKKCPGHCNDYVADWQHVNALIIGKPRLECVYRKFSGSISYCICCHQKNTSCNKCKKYKEPIHARTSKKHRRP